MKALAGRQVRRSFLAVFAALATASLALSVSADLDPAHTDTWELPRASLFAVATSGEHAWAVGYWGTILRSDDGGKTWAHAASTTAETLFAASFADAKNGWVAGAAGLILRTTDGGTTWTRQSVTVPDEMGGTRPLDVNLFGVAAISPTEAWVVGDVGTVLHTKDGSTWESVKFDAATYSDDNVPDRILNAVVFTSPTEGWIAGEFATLVRTHDGGATWTGARQITGAPADLYLFNVAAGGGSAAAVGLAGGVLVGNADGSEWTSRSVDTSAGLFTIAWQGQRGVAAGDRGVLFVTNDGGATWAEPKRPKLFNWIAGTAFAGSNVALAVGEGGLILRSEDGGATWTAPSLAEPGVAPNLHAVGGPEKKSAPSEKKSD
ncbi:MAG TPA: YCF48-related protein [Myxococcota bacterium]|nr:YCF48-related protein [Myxococcota bacterium]